MDEFTCKACIHAGEPHMFGDSLVVECKCAPVTINGFPIVNANTGGCTPGKKDSVPSECVESEPIKENDSHNYIMRKNEDGSVTTLHIPTVIMQLNDEMEDLLREREYNSRWSLWHLIKRS
jgi:hypothetical protein